MKTIWKMVPGLAMALVIAAAAKGLEYLEGLAGLHLIGASVIALFIGMVINRFFKPNAVTSPGIRFTSKKVLKLAIILLGASLNIMTVLKVGRFSLTVMLFTLATCFGVGYFIGKALGLNWKMSNLISAGTGICGGSAIAAIAPVIDATDVDVAYGMSATFLFDMAMIVLFPILGRWLGLSDAAYGLWAGTAVNDTSSVVAAGYAFSEQAGDFATMVKLTRTLAIIPTVLIFALIGMHVKKKEAAGDPSAVRVNMKSVFPWFILGFLALCGVNSLGFIPASVASVLKDISKFLMVTALAAIGLNTSFSDMRRAGLKPMLHGFIISLLVVLVADHGYPYPRTLAYNEPLRHRIPMIWTGGAVARPRVVEDYASQIDICATILGQLGIDHSDFDYSKDIFAPTPPRKFAYYTFNDGFGVVDASGEAVWDATSGKAVSETAPGLLDIGRTMLQTTYVDIGNR